MKCAGMETKRVWIIVRYCVTNSFSSTKKFCDKCHFSRNIDDYIFI